MFIFPLISLFVTSLNSVKDFLPQGKFRMHRTWFWPNLQGKAFLCAPRKDAFILDSHPYGFEWTALVADCLFASGESSRIESVFSFLKGEIQCSPKHIPLALSQAIWSPFYACPNCRAVIIRDIWRCLWYLADRCSYQASKFTGKISRPNKKYVRNGSYCSVLPSVKMLKWYQWG